MAEHPHVEVVRRGYAAFSSGDMATLAALFDPDIVHHVPGNNLIAGDHKGVEGVLALYGKLFELSDGTMKVELHDVVGNDEHVVAMHRASAARKGRTLESGEILVFHVRDGKIKEIWDYRNDEVAQDAFWS